MPHPHQDNLLDERMIARLEQANARAYAQLPRPNEKAAESSHDAKLESSDRQPSPATVERRPSRASPPVVVLILLPFIAIAFVTAFAWEPSYSDAVKVFARWANPWVLHGVPQARTLSDGVSAAAFISPEVAQRVQRMADDLANMERQIDQLRLNQEQTIRSEAAVVEQLQTSQEQMVRDNAKAIEQLNAALAQVILKSDGVAEQLKRSQEQLAELVSFRAMASVRRHERRARSPINPLKPRR
jgi:hypothetical protein